jgi:hypothetical protein
MDLEVPRLNIFGLERFMIKFKNWFIGMNS